MIGTEYVKGLNRVDPMPIDYSQDSINLNADHARIQQQLKQNAWNQQYSLDVVLYKKNPQKLVSLDNRRLYLAKTAKLETIIVNVHLGKDTDIESMQKRFESQYPEKIKKIKELKNWKDCIKFRVQNQTGSSKQTQSFGQQIKVRDKGFSEQKFWQQICSIETQ